MWWDKNHDGKPTANEPRLANVTVQLFAQACDAVLGAPTQTVATNGSGLFTFSMPQTGAACVIVDRNDLPANTLLVGAETSLDILTDAEPPPGYEDGDAGGSVSGASADMSQVLLLPFGPTVSDDRLGVGVTPPCSDIAWLDALAGGYQAQQAVSIPEICSFAYQSSDATHAAALHQALTAHPQVRWVEYDGFAAAYTPNDPYYGNPSYVYGPQMINAPAAWDITLGLTSTIVAVIDSGIDASHPEFAGRVLPGWDYVNDDADPTDDHGHGTHVTGIIAAGIDNGIGMAGIAGRAKILPVKVLNHANSGWLANVSKGLIHAVNNGAGVINLSFSSNGNSMSVRNAITYAINSDVVVVVAAGNTNTSTPQYPASYPGVLSVGALNSIGQRWVGAGPNPTSGSNYGPNVDIMAPGVGIFSTYHRLNGTPGKYAFYTGTSMAAPHVAGVAALMRGMHPTMTMTDVVRILRHTSSDLGDVGVDQFYGYGRVNAALAVSSARPGDCNADETVNADDLFAALVPELFDGDGAFWLDTPGSTFPGNPSGCDSNLDNLINAGDLSCTVLLVNGDVCTGWISAAATGALPQLHIADPLENWDGRESVSTPIILYAQGAAVNSLVFALDIGERFSFDAADNDANGMPDAINFQLPAGFAASATFDAGAADRELHISVYPVIDLNNPSALALQATLPDGVLATVGLHVAAQDEQTEGSATGLSISAPPNFGLTSGESVIGEPAGESAVESVYKLFVPLLMAGE